MLIASIIRIKKLESSKTYLISYSGFILNFNSLGADTQTCIATSFPENSTINIKMANNTLYKYDST